jgi:hypothetical protein
MTIAAIWTIVLVIPSLRSNSVVGLPGVGVGWSAGEAAFALVLTISLATVSDVDWSGNGVGSLISVHGTTAGLIIGVVSEPNRRSAQAAI